MKLFLNDQEVTLDELREAQDNLKMCPNDGGDYETIELDDIDEEGNLYFWICGHSTFE